VYESYVKCGSARMCSRKFYHNFPGKLLDLWPYIVAIVHALQPCDPACRINFCIWFLQSVHDGEVDPYLTFFQMKCGFICTDLFPHKIISTGVLLIDTESESSSSCHESLLVVCIEC
jgi:hypothetical protein